MCVCASCHFMSFLYLRNHWMFPSARFQPPSSWRTTAQVPQSLHPVYLGMCATRNRGNWSEHCCANTLWLCQNGYGKSQMFNTYVKLPEGNTCQWMRLSVFMLKWRTSMNPSDLRGHLCSDKQISRVWLLIKSDQQLPWFEHFKALVWFCFGDMPHYSTWLSAGECVNEGQQWDGFRSSRHDRHGSTACLRN